MRRDRSSLSTPGGAEHGAISTFSLHPIHTEPLQNISGEKKKFSYIYTYFPHSSEAARCILSKLSQQAPDKETWAEACAGCLRTLRVQQKHNCRGPILHLESHPPFYIPSTAMRTGLGGRKRLAGPGEAAHLAASRLLWPKQEQFQSDARKSPPSLQRTGKGPQNHCCKARDGIRAF